MFSFLALVTSLFLLRTPVRSAFSLAVGLTGHLAANSPGAPGRMPDIAGIRPVRSIGRSFGARIIEDCSGRGNGLTPDLRTNTRRPHPSGRTRFGLFSESTETRRHFCAAVTRTAPARRTGWKSPSFRPVLRYFPRHPPPCGIPADS